MLSISTLSLAICRAESAAIIHNFDEMKVAGTLTFPGAPSDYSTGVTNEVTYTGSTGGGFGMSGTKVCITLPNNGVMQTSPAIAHLTRLQLIHTKGSAPKNIKVYISTDNATWTDISSSEVCSFGDIDVAMPTKGDYYLKVVNKSGESINFLSFRYTYDPCHCLRVVSE